jgi:hypothetical protein
LWVSLIFDFCNNQLENGCIHITRAVRVGQVNLTGTSVVATQSRVMLHTVTRTIDMHGDMRYILLGVRVFHGVGELDHNPEGLPWIIRLQPI